MLVTEEALESGQGHWLGYIGGLGRVSPGERRRRRGINSLPSDLRSPFPHRGLPGIPAIAGSIPEARSSPVPCSTFGIFIGKASSGLKSMALTTGFWLSPCGCRISPPTPLWTAVPGFRNRRASCYFSCKALVDTPDRGKRPFPENFHPDWREALSGRRTAAFQRTADEAFSPPGRGQGEKAEGRSQKAEGTRHEARGTQRILSGAVREAGLTVCRQSPGFTSHRTDEHEQ